MLTRTVTAITGVSYNDFRVGEYHNVHEMLVDASLSAASRDADNKLPPGLPLLATGGPITGAGQVAVGLVGPEAVSLGATNVFANAVVSGLLNRKMIESNLGRVLSANELSAIATGLPAVILR